MTPESTRGAGPGSDYPIRLRIPRPERQSRLLNLPLFVGTLIRYLLLIPHLLLLSVLVSAAYAAVFFALWGILATGRYPQGLFNLVVGVMRWYSGVAAYQNHLFDQYPPMDVEHRQDGAFEFEADYPSKPSRLLNLPFFPVKFILLIPHVILLAMLGVVVFILILLAQFAILLSGSFPADMHGFVTGVTRWNARVYGYLAGLTDKYPPFSFS